jgi:uncharacterized protein
MFIRVPILSAIGSRSPFEDLVKHAFKVSECIQLWKQAVSAYLEKKYDIFERLSEEVQKLEHEADLIKGKISAHLPKGIYMPVYKSDFMMCLKEQDSILDFAEDTVIWLGFKKVDMAFIKDGMLEHTQKIAETVQTLEKVALGIKDFFAGLRKKNREEMKQLIKEVHRLEWESDRIEKKLTKQVFNSDKDFLSIYFIIKAINLTAAIANHAENAGDRIRAMIAK